MRNLVGLICVLALGLMGCGETAGTGGSGGTAGSGGSAGTGGLGGGGGMAGTGGTGGIGGDGGTGGNMGDIFPCTEEGIRKAIAAGGGPHRFDCDGTAPVVTQAEIRIDNDVILDGEGKLTVDGGGGHRVFEVVHSRVELRGMTVSGGQGPTGRSSYGAGGILQNGGVLTLMNCTVSGNVNAGFNPWGVNQPGNILTRGGDLVVMNSTVSNNTGGGISSEFLTITNSTVSGNLGYPVNPEPRWASGIYTTWATISNSTISGEIAIYGRSVGPPVPIDIDITATLIDGECQMENEARLTTNGYNIESPGDTCGFDQEGDQSGVSAELLNLGPLADNDGPTMTHALLLGSPPDVPASVAIDAIPQADCLDADGEPLIEDQRGQPRPETGGTMCDVGAFEVQP